MRVRTEQMRAYYLAHREERLRLNKVWREANPEKVRAYRLKAQTSDRNKDYRLRTKFGISLADYRAMFEAQGGVCAICQQPETRRSTTGKPREFMSVDHDHATGRVRGLTCSKCNAGMGHFNDDPALLRRAEQYLEGAAWADMLARSEAEMKEEAA